jgi:hypothetical protein
MYPPAAAPFLNTSKEKSCPVLPPSKDKLNFASFLYSNPVNMTKTYRLLIVAFLAVFIVACSKEKSFDPSSGNSGNTMKGDWKFVSLHVKGQTIVEVPSFDAKTVSIFEYTTKNNTGTVNITSDKISYANLSYSVDTTFMAYYYDAGVLVDSFDFPLVVTMPTTSVTTPYQYFAPDSIYYPGGSPMSMGGTTVTTQAAGGTFKVENDKLTITTKFYERRNQTNQGQQQILTASGVSVATLQKQ